MTFEGHCPHCGEVASFAWVDYKRQVICPHCEKPLFSSLDGWLKLTNFLLFLSLFPAMIGMAFRASIGNMVLLGLILSSVCMVLMAYFIEGAICKKCLGCK